MKLGSTPSRRVHDRTASASRSITASYVAPSARHQTIASASRGRTAGGAQAARRAFAGSRSPDRPDAPALAHAVLPAQRTDGGAHLVGIERIERVSRHRLLLGVPAGPAGPRVR